MVKICSHTIAKNSEDFIIRCLTQILPFVDKALVSIDNASTDSTFQLVSELSKENKKVEILRYNADNPFVDLVKERNRQIELTSEDWFWIIDDDEYYLTEEAERIIRRINNDFDAYSVKFWYLADSENYYPRRGKRTIRFYKKKEKMKWEDIFSKEKILVDSCNNLENSYIHLSYLKKYSWRESFAEEKFWRKESNIKRRLPDNIIKELLWLKQETF